MSDSLLNLLEVLNEVLEEQESDSVPAKKKTRGTHVSIPWGTFLFSEPPETGADVWEILSNGLRDLPSYDLFDNITKGAKNREEKINKLRSSANEPPKSITRAAENITSDKEKFDLLLRYIS